MKVEQLYTGCLAHGAYYIESNGEAAIIDPLREVQQYIDMANERGAKALVTGESLGQVGSQTLENLVTVRSAVTLPFLSPLIGMDKQEIIGEARNIDTYPVSILPDEDCCTLFVPKHPATRSTPEEVGHLESALDVPGLVEKAMAQIEVKHITQDGVSSAKSSY